RGIGPGAADFDIEPFAENGVAGAESDRGQHHTPAEGRPAKSPRERGGNRKCRYRDQNVAGGAMDGGKRDRALCAGGAPGGKRQLRRLPKEMPRRGKADRERGPRQERAIGGITDGQSASGAHW